MKPIEVCEQFGFLSTSQAELFFCPEQTRKLWKHPQYVLLEIKQKNISVLQARKFPIFGKFENQHIIYILYKNNIYNKHIL